MTTLLLSTLVQAAILATGADATPASAESYAEAHRQTTETGRPMVIMVSTDWCPPCQTMKKSVLPRVREHGLLKKVAFALVNPDRDKDLAEKLTGGGPIPQLVMFRKTNDGWVRKKLVGGQSVETVEEFISEGLVNDKAERGVEIMDNEDVPEGDATSNQHSSTSDGDPSAQNG